MRTIRVAAVLILAFVSSSCTFNSPADSSDPEAGVDDAQVAVQDAGNELAERQARRSESNHLFLRSDFAELERLGEFYRASSQRTSSGTWSLSLFYDGIGDVALGYENNRHDLWRKDLNRFDEWIGQYPDSATPHIARAAALMGRAWQVRGGGYAGTVGRVQMDKFHELAAEAGEYLMRQSHHRFKDPHWYELMLEVYQALGTSKDTFWELYTEGLERYPDYDPIIFMAANYYLPRWHGSLEDIEKLARYTSEQTESTRDFAPYARIYWIAGFVRQEGKYAFQLPSANWADMVRGMDAVIERYPSQWNLNHFGFFACYAGDPDTAARYIKLVEEPIFEEAWISRQYYQGCRRSLGPSSSSGDAQAQTFSDVQPEIEELRGRYAGLRSLEDAESAGVDLTDVITKEQFFNFCWGLGRNCDQEVHTCTSGSRMCSRKRVEGYCAAESFCWREFLEPAVTAEPD